MPGVFQPVYSGGFANGATGSRTVAVTLSAVPVGFTLIAIGTFINDSNSLGAPYSCADNGSGSWVSAGAALVGNTTSGWDMAAFVCKSSAGNPTTVTITQQAGHAADGFAGIIVACFSNILPTTIIDGYAANVQASPGTGTNAATSGNFTTTHADDLIFSTTFGGPGLFGTGFTSSQPAQTGNNVSNQATEYIPSAASGTHAGTWSFAAGPSWSMTIGFALQTLPCVSGSLAMLGVGCGIALAKALEKNDIITRRGLMLPWRH